MANQFQKHLGIDLFGTTTSQEHYLGKRVETVWGTAKDKPISAVYIKAEATLTAGQVCELPLIGGTDAFQVDTPLTKTNAAALLDSQWEQMQVCFPLTDMVSGEYGWAGVSGVVPALLAALAPKYERLALTATAGVLDNADVDYELLRAVPITTVGAAQALTDIMISVSWAIIQRTAA